MLEQERAYFDNHLEEWLGQYHGKTVLVKGEELIGVFDSNTEALSEGARRYGLDSFLVRPVQQSPGAVVIPALMLGILSTDTPPDPPPAPQPRPQPWKPPAGHVDTYVLCNGWWVRR